MTPVERILSSSRPRRAKRQWLDCRCPAHDDRTASISIGEDDESRALVYCHAGCSTGDVLGASTLDAAARDDERARGPEHTSADLAALVG